LLFSKVDDIIDSIWRLLMKSFRQEMEKQAEEDDFNPEDILNAFKELEQPKQPV
jgi:hypothetical protein